MQVVGHRDPAKVEQEVTVEVTIPARSLAHWDDQSHAWAIEQGVFRLAVGSSYSDERLTTDIAVAGPNI